MAISKNKKDSYKENNYGNESINDEITERKIEVKMKQESRASQLARPPSRAHLMTGTMKARLRCWHFRGIQEPSLRLDFSQSSMAASWPNFCDLAFRYLRRALCEAKPRIKKSVDSLQHQPSQGVERGFQWGKREPSMNVRKQVVWEEGGGHWRPWLWQLIMTPPA